MFSRTAPQTTWLSFCNQTANAARLVHTLTQPSTWGGTKTRLVREVPVQIEEADPATVVPTPAINLTSVNVLKGGVTIRLKLQNLDV